MTVHNEAASAVSDLSDESIADRIELIGALALAQHASGFLQLHDELLVELERSDVPRSGTEEVGNPHA
ncbi:hypothetical protein [Leucobacter salsicius]|uniref:hypothetical protein n=1 Tax=Leucobacter salsicius TaxID=664638 RepID=UPI00034DA8C8|nr:hypothetical protein [Leucobacter salsicius]